MEIAEMEEIKEMSVDGGDGELPKLESIDMDQIGVKWGDLEIGESQEVYGEMQKIEDKFIEHLDIGKMDSDRDSRKELIEKKIDQLGVKMRKVIEEINEVKNQTANYEFESKEINKKIYQDHINGSTFKKLSSTTIF